MSDYTPIHCDVYDKLEAMATLHRIGNIIYRSAAGDTIEVNDKLVDIYAQDGADYCELSQGTVIRLDRLIAIIVGGEKIL